MTFAKAKRLYGISVLEETAEAIEILEDHGFKLGRDFRLSDAVLMAGSVLLELELEDAQR